jgi:hypothetical protein
MNNLDTFLKELPTHSTNALTVSKEVLADGEHKVTLAMEHTLKMPERMESPRRAHVFHEITGFAQYLNSMKRKDQAAVLVDGVKLEASAVLDESAAGGYEVIRFIPMPHPTLTLLRETLIGRFDPKRLAEGVMRNRDVIIGVDGDDSGASKQLAMLMKQITISSSVEAAQGESLNGVMVETKVKAGTAKDSICLPRTLRVMVPLFMHTMPVQFDLCLTVSPLTADRVVICVDAPELDALLHHEFMMLTQQIKDTIPHIFIGLGCLSYAEWKYNK